MTGPRTRFYTILTVVAGVLVLAAVIHAMDYNTAFEISRMMR